jgi:hypothetical protein
MSEIQRQVGRGEYEVDTHAVAEAILRRLMQGHDRPPAGDSGDQPD